MDLFRGAGGSSRRIRLAGSRAQESFLLDALFFSVA